MDVALAAFRRAYPSYDATRALDDLRAREYARLDEQNHIYLDYTGGGLYADSQIREHMALLKNGVFGNPHSTNPASEATTRLATIRIRLARAAAVVAPNRTNSRRRQSQAGAITSGAIRP